LERFGFILHPLSVRDISRKFPLAAQVPDEWVERVMQWIPPVKISHVTGVKSAWSEAEGWFVACPLTSQQMLFLPQEMVIKKIVNAGRVAEKLGAKIVGLGAFTSIVGDAGISIAKQLGIAVTTGNSYTVATALEGTRLAAAEMGTPIEQAHVVVVGATGSIGGACSQILAGEAKRVTLAARDEVRLTAIAEQVRRHSGASVDISTDVRKAVRMADVVIAVTSAVDAIIEPEDLKCGAVVCDVARPRNVSKRVAELRDDVLVIEGGIVEVPGDVDFHFNFGFPPGMAYACMAETMILALEQRYENFTLGREISVEQIQTIEQLAKKHGFKLAGLRSFERALSEQELGRIKQKARLSPLTV